jgi:hypothetical protein
VNVIVSSADAVSGAMKRSGDRGDVFEEVAFD